MTLSGLLARAREGSARLLLAGGDPALLAQVAVRLAESGLRHVTHIGPGGVDPDSHPQLEAVATLLRSRAPERVRDAIHALDLAADPVRFALGLCALGEADAVLAGPGIPVDELVDATVWTLGAPAAGDAFHFAAWLLLADGRLVGFADCVPSPALDPGGRERLARAFAELHRQVAGELPRPAALPGFRGDENVLIFPDGAAGALALAIAGRLAGATILGPVLLGARGMVSGVGAEAGLDELVGTAAATVLAAGYTGT